MRLTEDQLDLRALADRASRLLKVRSGRAGVFGERVGAMLTEPAYDILLDLFVALHTGRVRYVMDACVVGGVPTTTTYRVLEQLIAAGIVASEIDNLDRRRRILSLSKAGSDAMVQHLSAMESLTSGPFETMRR